MGTATERFRRVCGREIADLEQKMKHYTPHTMPQVVRYFAEHKAGIVETILEGSGLVDERLTMRCRNLANAIRKAGEKRAREIEKLLTERRDTGKKEVVATTAIDRACLTTPREITCDPVYCPESPKLKETRRARVGQN